MAARSAVLAVALLAFAAEVQFALAATAPTPIQVVGSVKDWSTFHKACLAVGLDKDKNWNDASYQGTTYVPTNKAFENLAKQLKTSVDKLLKDKATLKSILAYHIVPSWQWNGWTSMYNGQLQSTALTRLNNRSKLRVIVDSKGNISLEGDKNTAHVSKVKQSVKKGRFIEINTVLLPDTKSAPAKVPNTFDSAYTAIANTPNLEDFTAVLNRPEHKDLKQLLMNTKTTLTVLAPNNNALFNIIKLLGVTAEQFYGNKAYMNEVIESSILPNQYKTHMDFYHSKGKRFNTMLKGHQLQVAITRNLENHVFLKGDLTKAKLRWSQPAPIPTLTPKATNGKYDLPAGKHMVHVVDNWILPKTKNTPK